MIGHGEPGDAASRPPELLTATTAARRLGVAVETLRTWDRRYGSRPVAAPSGKLTRLRLGPSSSVAELVG